MLYDEYPPTAFYFKVAFVESAGLYDTSFKEVSGIGASIETEPYKELSENEFVHQLPKSVTYTNLILKRGIASMTSPLVLWCQAIFNGSFSKPMFPLNLLVYLMDAEDIPIRAWSINSAFPVKWSVDSFESQKNSVAIETIELKYNSMSRIL